MTVSSQPCLTTVVFTIHIIPLSLVSFFSKHALNAACGRGTGNAKMTTMWSLAQEAYCLPVGERSLQSRSMRLLTEEDITLGQQRGPGKAFSEEHLEHKLDYYRKRRGKDIPEGGNSMFRVWKRGHWFQK